MARLRTGRGRSAAGVPRELRGVSPLIAGLVGIVLLSTVTYFGFSKHIPFTHDFRLRAVFASANSITKNSPVRIAGVNVGKVTGVQGYNGDRSCGSPGSTASCPALVTMELSKSALPIHSDATLKVRPRIFLEGNFFIDLKPGSPSQPKLSDDGKPVPATQTAEPVQLDEVLTALQSNSRQDLRDLLAGYGQALTHTPTAREDATQDRSVRGLTAAQALNSAFSHSGAALRGTAQVNSGLLGTQRHDLSKLVAGVDRVAVALDRNESALQGLITNLDGTLAAFAAESSNLRATVRLLAPTFVHAHAAFRDLNAAFPPTRAFARDILPGVRILPQTIHEALPWIDQTRGLLGADELRGLAGELAATIPNLAQLVDRTITLLPKVDLVDRCLTDVILPTGDIVIQDGPLTTGVPNYKEFWYSMVGLSSEGSNFDGNGPFVRFQPGGGLQTVSTGASSLSGEALFGNSISTPAGVRPKYPGRRPPYKPDVPCHTQPLPNLNAAVTGPADRPVGRNAGLRVGRRSLTGKLLQSLNPFSAPSGRR